MTLLLLNLLIGLNNWKRVRMVPTKAKQMMNGGDWSRNIEKDHEGRGIGGSELKEREEKPHYCR